VPPVRIPPREPPYPDDVRTELEHWMPPGAPVEPLRLFRTLVRHPELARAMRPLGSFLLGRGLGLSRRERELVIARVCARCGCAYEWGVHATAFGAAAGLGPEELAATVPGAPSPSGGAEAAWSERDALLLRLVDALHDTGSVDDALWRELTRHYDAERMLELLVLAGWYHVIAYVANAVGVEPEPWAAEMPDSAR